MRQVIKDNVYRREHETFNLISTRNFIGTRIKHEIIQHRGITAVNIVISYSCFYYSFSRWHVFLKKINILQCNVILFLNNVHTFLKNFRNSREIWLRFWTRRVAIQICSLSSYFLVYFAKTCKSVYIGALIIIILYVLFITGCTRAPVCANRPSGDEYCKYIIRRHDGETQLNYISFQTENVININP